MAQTLNKGEVDCIHAWHNDANLWMLAWKRVGECIDEGLNIRVLWAKEHTSLEEEAKMSLENHQVARANARTDELAKMELIKTVPKWQSVLPTTRMLGMTLIVSLLTLRCFLFVL